MHFDPRVALALLGYYIFSSAAGAMLPPIAGEERSGYGYLYRFVQALAANGHRLVESRIPVITAGADGKVAHAAELVLVESDELDEEYGDGDGEFLERPLTSRFATGGIVSATDVHYVGERGTDCHVHFAESRPASAPADGDSVLEAPGTPVADRPPSPKP